MADSVRGKGGQFAGKNRADDSGSTEASGTGENGIGGGSGGQQPRGRGRPRGSGSSTNGGKPAEPTQTRAPDGQSPNLGPTELSATEVFEQLKGEQAPPRKAKENKTIDSVTQMVNTPFALAGMGLALLGEEELAELMPLSTDEEKALADSVFSALKGNPAVLASIEKAAGGISLVSLAVTLGTILAPRVAAIQRVWEVRSYERRTATPAPPADTGGFSTDYGTGSGPAAEAGVGADDSAVSAGSAGEDSAAVAGPGFNLRGFVSGKG